MDNLTHSILLIERIEQVPRNDIELYRMDWFKIRSLMKNPCSHDTQNSCSLDKQNPCSPDKQNSCSPDKQNPCSLDTQLYKNDQMLKIISNAGSFSWLIMFYKNQKIIPQEAINYWLIIHKEKNINYNIVLFEIDITKLPDKFYSYFTDSFYDDFYFEYLINIMKNHFEEMNNLNNKSSENETISNIITKSTKEYFKSKAIEQPKFIKTQLYLFQRVNVYWMNARESEPLKIELSDNKIINWGPQIEINIDQRVVYNKINQTINNFNSSMSNQLIGGCLCDDVGLGKTLQILTLALLKPSITLIIVPPHLLQHWINEYDKHIGSNSYSELIVCNGLAYNFDSTNHNQLTNHNQSTNQNQSTQQNELVKYLDSVKHNKSIKNHIVLGTFDHLKSGLFNNFKFTRIVIDEFHEIADIKYNLVDKLNADYKWVVTATPFVNSHMIAHIINFVGKYPIQYQNIIKYKKYINIFSEMFRKNTKKNVENEINLPHIKEIKYFLTFSQKEKLFYESIINNQDVIKMKRNFCINPSLYFKKDAIDSFVSIDSLDDILKEHHQKEHDTLDTKINKLKREWFLNPNVKEIFIAWDHKLKNKEDFTCEEIQKYWDTGETLNLIVSYTIGKFASVNNKFQTIKSTMNYFNSQLELINKSKLVQSSKLINTNTNAKTNTNTMANANTNANANTECSICLDTLDSKFTILHCGHMFCYDCIKLISKSPLTKCPMCKIGLTNTTNYVFGVEIQPNNYGTKINKLIKICKEKQDKIILFSHTKELLENLGKILGEYKIKAKLFNQFEAMTFEQDDTQVLILSSESNASGLNFQFVKTIILLEPLDGNYIYRKQIENQIIGRLHRIGQTQPIEFIRLIMLNSIESQIDTSNKINDAIFAEINDEYNLEMIQQIIIDPIIDPITDPITDPTTIQ